MNPKKLLLALTVTAALLGVTIPMTSAEAGSYRSRVEGTCGYCNKAVYAYYRPIGYDNYGRSSYSWVISHHTACRNNYRSSRQTYTRTVPSVGFSINLGTPGYYSGYRNNYRSYGSHYHRGYSGYRSYGRGGYCR